MITFAFKCGDLHLNIRLNELIMNHEFFVCWPVGRGIRSMSKVCGLIAYCLAIFKKSSYERVHPAIVYSQLL